MTSLPDNSRQSSVLSPAPPFAHQALFYLYLGWLAFTPVGVGLASYLLPETWPEPWRYGLSGGLLVGLLAAPLAGLAWLNRRGRWPGLWPFVVALLATTGYVILAVAVRMVAEPGSSLGIVLHLAGLTLAALAIGLLALRWAGVPGSRLLPVLGLGFPAPAGLLLALALIALLTLGWPLTGTLGDSRTSLLILLRALATSLPEEILFRGAVLGLLLYNFPQRRLLAALAALLVYVAFTPSLVVPRNDWGQLTLLITAIPFTLLLLILREMTGTIWPGLLFIWAYRAVPLLFTDPRVELPLITQPWQTLAHAWMLLGVGVLALLLWAAQRWLVGRRHFNRLAVLAVSAGAAVLLGGMWLGLWKTAGRPGFYNDGFLIIMAEQADLSEAGEIEDLVARRAMVREQLLEVAARTQPPVREALKAAGLPYRPYYLINMIRVTGHHDRMAEFASLPGVARVMLNPNVRPYPFDDNEVYGPAPEAGQGVEWNIQQTGADQVWDMGFTGDGIIVGGQDTGYDWDHPALRQAYRGYRPEGTAVHDYNWHDAWAGTPAPFDDGHHGTHTMGTILGEDGNGNQVGMAPGAAWIGCRNMQRGLGNPASYTECMEFFLAPYPVGGDPFEDGDVRLAPHVVNNSWGCPDMEGCDDDVLEPATAALRAAGIMMVVSAGNEGPGCLTVAEPPARYDNVLSVGATDNSGAITGFSSRGPVPGAAEPVLLKPDVVAPGDNIRSSLPGNEYGLASGTSMAGPHVTGLVALLWSANPALIGDIDTTEEIIRQTAIPQDISAACGLEALPAQDTTGPDDLDSLAGPEACACGGVTGTPNNVYGWGQIDALAAVKMALELK